MSRRLIRTGIRQHALWLALPSSAAVLGAMVTVDRFALHATTSPWTYWKDGLTLLISLFALWRAQFPRTSMTLHWMDDRQVPADGPDGSCVFTFRLSMQGQSPSKVNIRVEPAFDVTSLAQQGPAPAHAVRLESSVGEDRPGHRDIQVRLGSARLPAARGPLFCQGKLVLEVEVHFPGEASRLLRTEVPICLVVGGGRSSC